MKTFAVDFETFYSDDFSIGETGTYKYLRDERTDIYLVSVVGENFEFVGSPKEFDWEILSQARLVMHNASFDGDVINALREKGVIPSAVSFADMCCSADMSCALGGPRSLKNAAKAWLAMEMSKDVRDRMKNKRFCDLGPEEKEELKKYALDDARITYKLWMEYSEYWSETERAVSKLNRELGWYGCRIDVPSLEKQKQTLHAILFDTEKLIPWSSEDVPLLSPKRLRKYCLEQGITLPKSVAEKNPEYIEWLKDYEDKVEVIKHLRNWRKANILLQKLNILESRVREDGTFVTELKYVGASQTGRFSGMAKFNLQNLPREDWNGVDIRKLFIARPDKTLVVADYSQIEARVVNWLSGNTKMLDTMREGWNIYEAFAKSTNMAEFEKGTLKKKNPQIYAAAKAQTLGASYGLGHVKFVTVAPILTGGAYTPTLEESKLAISNFRKNNPCIVSYWKRLEEGFLNHIRRASTNRRFDYVVTLPSGREMVYWSPTCNLEYRKENNADAPLLKTWGGKLCENMCQAVARDIMVDAMLRLTKQNIQILFTVHDEIVAEVPSATAEQAEKEIQKIMSTAPAWAEGLPLGVETKITEHYEK